MNTNAFQSDCYLLSSGTIYVVWRIGNSKVWAEKWPTIPNGRIFHDSDIMESLKPVVCKIVNIKMK